ncbi:MAG: hypothetical protein F4Y70_11080, partial [Chloroflexi bacterium]|nr:hypothetical protein [Chloroflexota bacterium]MYA91931.1 hypothetical protein [Chloroflexota bacterium]MYD38669.1 hypothetical protein [Chloroflexota bacterium]MYH66550.1 hypothetical protein [Chloroflexota bacterium]
MPVELQATITIGNFDSATYKDVWFIHYRPQIQILMSGSPDNHIAALLLIIACMDRIYVLANPEKSSKRGYTRDMMKFFFPKPAGQDEEEYERRMKTMTEDFVNALKHDSFVRDNVMLSDKVASLQTHGVEGKAIEVVVQNHVRNAVTYEDNGKLTIAPTAFWNVIRDFIARFGSGHLVSDATSRLYSMM